MSTTIIIYVPYQDTDFLPFKDKSDCLSDVMPPPHTHTHTHTPTPTHFHRQPRTHDFSLQNRGPIHSDFSQWNRGLLCENLTLNRHNEDLDILPPMGDLPPYASLSYIAPSASFKKPRTSSVFCVSSFVGKMSNVCPRS